MDDPRVTTATATTTTTAAASANLLHALAEDAIQVRVAKDVVVATGVDRVRFLHGILTGNVAGTPIGGGCHAALLTLKAHVVADMLIFVRESELFLVTAVAEGAPMTEALSRYAIMDDFSVVPRPEFSLLGVLGPAANHRLDQIGYNPGVLSERARWSHADLVGPLGPFWLARAHQLGADGYWVGAPAPDVARFAAALTAAGVPALGLDLAEAARIAAGEPAWGQEITTDYFPMEVGLDDAIDYTKGCFLGQEPIVRIRDRGHINWRLARLNVAGTTDPRPGDRLQSETKPKAGKVTSFARLPDGRGVALGLVHVSVPAGDSVRILVSGEGGETVTATVAP